MVRMTLSIPITAALMCARYLLPKVDAFVRDAFTRVLPENMAHLQCQLVDALPAPPEEANGMLSVGMFHQALSSAYLACTDEEEIEILLWLNVQFALECQKFIDFGIKDLENEEGFRGKFLTDAVETIVKHKLELSLRSGWVTCFGMVEITPFCEKVFDLIRDKKYFSGGYHKKMLTIEEGEIKFVEDDEWPALLDLPVH